MNTLEGIACLVGGKFTVNTDGVKNVSITYRGKDNKTIIKSFARCNLTEDKFKLKKGINICLDRIMATNEMDELLNKEYKILEHKVVSHLCDRLLYGLTKQPLYQVKDSKNLNENCLNNINHDYF